MIVEQQQAQAAGTKTWVVPFIATLLAMMTLQTASLGFAPLLPAIQHQFSMTFSQLGLFTGAYGILAILFSLPAGLLVKRFGARPVLCTGLLVVVVGLVAFALSNSFPTVLASRIIWIGGYRFAFVSVLAALASTCPPSLRGRTMGIVGSLASLASVVGAPFGGLMSVHLGWRGGMFGFAALAAIGLVIFFLLFRVPEQVVSAKVVAIAPEKNVSAFLVPRVWALALFSGLVGIPAFGATFFGPSAAKMNFHLDAVGTGWIISGGYLLGIFLSLLTGFLMDRFDKWTVLAVLIGCATPCALLMNSHDLTVFRLATAAVIAISFTAVNQSYGLASDVLRGSQVGNVMGILSLGAGLTGFAGPQLLGILRDKTHTFNAGWYMIAAVAAFTCVEVILLGFTARKAARQNGITLARSQVAARG